MIHHNSSNSDQITIYQQFYYDDEVWRLVFIKVPISKTALKKFTTIGMNFVPN